MDIKEMAEAGLHFGHKPTKLHPKMEPFIYGKKGTVHLIDLEKTKRFFGRALDWLQEEVRKGSTVLLVGTKIQHKGLVREVGQECGMPYVTERWLGGLITNFKMIRDRIEYFKEFREKINSSEFEKYTKKEQQDMKKELARLERKFGGLENLERLPDGLFICDLCCDNLAFREARKKDIPVAAVVDTNADPTFVDFPVPANDDARSSMEYILSKVREAMSRGEEEAEGEGEGEEMS